MGQRRPRLYGHRGHRGAGLENTLRAFGEALDAGADGIELDVRPCRSGELVVFHDADLARMVGRPQAVAELSLAELGRQRLLHSGESVPSLAQALDCILARGALLNVELKPDVPDLQAASLQLAQQLARLSDAERSRLTVSSFSRRALAWVRGAVEVRTGYLFQELPEVLPEGIWAVHPQHGLVNAQNLARFRQQGLAVNVWTVNDADEALRLTGLGVDALISDQVPQLLTALA